MQRPDFSDQIKSRINSSEPGSVYITSDFFDIAETQAVNKALSRLEQSGFIRRIMRGVYEYPEYSGFLGENIAPDPDKVAQALARNYGWSISPCGDTALNRLGLSTQIPSVWQYVSDGPYKEYRYDNVKIRFRHRTNREISGLSPKTSLIIQALKTLGKDRITDDALSKLSSILSDEDKSTMLREARQATVWIYEAIKSVCGSELPK
jgi:hypothetical protein